MRMLRVTSWRLLQFCYSFFAEKHIRVNYISYFTILYIASVALREGSQAINACVGRSACLKRQLLLQSFNRSAVGHGFINNIS
jgi:hypothetical protein